MPLRGMKWLLASGLVMITGPLCVSAWAQDYVDLEAERAAARAAAPAVDVTDPYGVRPAQSYPTTRYGVQGASPRVAAPGVATPGATAPGAIASTGNTAGANLGTLFYQLQQLQQEVMRLNGKVEEQAHEIRQLRQSSRDRYRDIDRRLGGGGNPLPDESNGLQGTEMGGDSPAVVAGGRGDDALSGMDESDAVAAEPGEAAAYQGAYSLVSQRNFNDAIPAFERFLRDYPEGKYAPNAYYWLGELYLVRDPVDLESSRQAFALLMSQYPRHAKIPDATYKLATVHFMKGSREKAREYLDLVISQYSSSNPGAVELAKAFIAENY